MNLLQQAAIQLQSRMEANASESVVYTRTGYLDITVSAVIGRSIVEQDSGEGFMLKVVARDFTISQAALLYLNPARGDKITQTMNDSVVEFFVEGGPGQPHYEETDGFGVAWRIHTKRDKVTRWP